MNVKEFFNDFGKTLYHIDAIYSSYAKNSKVTPTLIWILYALNDNNSHSQKDICFDWSLPKSTVNTLVMMLKKDDYVELIPIKGKRRDMNVILTNKGKEFANSVLKEIYEIEKNVYSKLDFDVKSFVINLKKIEKLLEEK